MKIGDLIRDKDYPEDIGMIMEIKQQNSRLSYRVLNLYGAMTWFSRYYIEKGCGLIKEDFIEEV